jgi:DNA-binding GntR family transcriptional regulator
MRPSASRSSTAPFLPAPCSPKSSSRRDSECRGRPCGRLATDGLVASHSGRGLVVTDVSVDRIRDLFEVRQALEEQAARLAARHRDPLVFEQLQREFAAVSVDDTAEYYALVARLDAAIDDATRNPFLVSTLDGVRIHVARIRRLAQDNPERLRQSVGEHLLIVDAIVDGSESLAAHATQLHLYRSLRNILSSLPKDDA